MSPEICRHTNIRIHTHKLMHIHTSYQSSVAYSYGVSSSPKTFILLYQTYINQITTFASKLTLSSPEDSQVRNNHCNMIFNTWSNMSNKFTYARALMCLVQKCQTFKDISSDSCRSTNKINLGIKTTFNKPSFLTHPSPLVCTLTALSKLKSKTTMEEWRGKMFEKVVILIYLIFRLRKLNLMKREHWQ